MNIKPRRLMEFFIIGVLFGIVQDLIAIKFATGEGIDLQTVGVVFIVALPFAIFSELVVDRKHIWPGWLRNMKRKKRRLMEFFIIGLAFGITEDLIAINLATGKNIDLEMVGVVFVVVLPFAVFSEMIVDRPHTWPEGLRKKLKVKIKKDKNSHHSKVN